MRSGVRKRKDLPRGAVSGNAELKRQKPSAKSDDIVVATAARVDTLFCGAVSRIESTRSGIANENQRHIAEKETSLKHNMRAKLNEFTSCVELTQYEKRLRDLLKECETQKKEIKHRSNDVSKLEHIVKKSGKSFASECNEQIC